MTRVLLFDIDQTLLWSGGAGGLAMRRAFHQLYGIEDGFRRVEFSGRTDTAILRAAMVEHDVLPTPASDGREAFAAEMARFQEAYHRQLERTLREVEGGRVMPGVTALLRALGERPDAVAGLATGNFRPAAFMKLAHFGIEGLSEGGFGDDAEDRGELVGIAIERVAGGAAPRDVWIIGDTPLDVEAAKANGARALGVATGSSTVEELRDAGADESVADLSDTKRVLSLLLG